MNRDDIIRMAEKAGCGWIQTGTGPALFGEEQIAKFANLIAAHEREALAQSDQLENCKKLLIERTSSLTKANYRLEQFNKQKPFGYYENDHGFYCPGFFTNQDKLVAEGTLIPLYCHPAPIPEGWQLAIDYYEQALKASWPEGANGEAFTHWNEARKALLSAAPKPE